MEQLTSLSDIELQRIVDADCAVSWAAKGILSKRRENNSVEVAAD